jgi:hypothetical protein
MSSPETVEVLVERLQCAFTKPWNDIASTRYPELDEISHLLKNCLPPTPSIWQVKVTLKNITQRKQLAHIKCQLVSQAGILMCGLGS